MAHESRSQTDEEGLQCKLAGLDDSCPEYAAVLSDLALMKLNKGEVAEAQRMFDRAAALRSGQFDAVVTTQGTGARSGQAGDRRSVTAGCPAQSSALGAGAGAPPAPYRSETPINSSTSSSNNTATPGGSRPRGVAGAGMCGGVTMFARALGGRPKPTRSRRDSGSDVGSETAPAAASAGAPQGRASPGPSGWGSESTASAPAAGAPSATPSRARATAAAPGQRGMTTGERSPMAEAAEAAATASVATAAGAASTAPAGLEGGRPAPETARAPGDGEALTSGRRRPEGTVSAGNGRRPSSDAAPPCVTTTAAADPASTVAATTPSQDRPSAAAATPTVVSEAAGSAVGAGGGGGGKYLSAAAAVAAMTEKQTGGWGSGSGSGSGGAGGAGGRHGNWQASNGAAGGASGGGRSAAAVKEYYLEPRAVDAEGDPSTSENEAALRAYLGECTHVLEVYNLTPEVRTAHLQEFVSELAHQDGRPLPVFKWVDDNHALLVCPDGATALYLLQVDQDLFQLRPFPEASAASKAVAAADLLPPRERPKTTAAVAKRLLSHALGMSQLRDRDAEKDLAEQRKAAREARREREQKLAAAWDDD